MSTTRRGFVRTIGLSAVSVTGAAIAYRGLEAELAAQALGQVMPEIPAGAIRISSNENPHGPGPHVVTAVQKALVAEGNRYSRTPGVLAGVVAQTQNVPPASVLMASGSGDLLRAAVLAYTSASRPLVTGVPSYEGPVRVAEALAVPVTGVPVTGALGLDLPAMVRAAKGAGLVFLCNPNNPTGTVLPKAAVASAIGEIRAASPSTVIVVDEAYYDCVDDPAYGSLASLAAETPGVMVLRTFSKIHGLAGLRIGYAVGHPDTLAKYRIVRRTERDLERLGRGRTGVPRGHGLLRVAAASEPRDARVDDKGTDRPRVRARALAGQLRPGGRTARRACVQRRVPGEGRAGLAAVSATGHARAHLDRHARRDDSGDGRVPRRPRDAGHRGLHHRAGAGTGPMKRRRFLEAVARAGGAMATLKAMEGMGLAVAPADAGPLSLHGGATGLRIVIVGAGVAGLATAYELEKAGHHCTVLEARTRIGGRVFTVRGGTAETDVDGHRQTARFDEGLYYNAGAMRIPQHHTITLDYCRELGVPVEPFLNSNEGAFLYSSAGSLAGKRSAKPRRARRPAGLRRGTAREGPRHARARPGPRRG